MIFFVFYAKSLYLADSLLDQLPLFQNLTSLELSMLIEKHIIQKVLNFLQFTPNLEFLAFFQVCP